MSNHERLPLAAVALLKRDKIDVNDVDLENYTTVENLLADKAGRAQPAKMPHSRRLDSYDIDDILVGNIRPYLKKIWHSDHAGGTNGDVLVFQARKDVENPILPRYLYHILASDQYFQYLQDHRKEGKMPRGDRNQALNFEILLPAPQVQEQIVTILDTFTDLDASMNRELELREAQFAHHRELLLDFNEGQSNHQNPTYPVPSIVDLLEELCPDSVPMAPLRRVAQIHRGNRVTKAQLQVDGKYPVMSGGITPMGYLDRANQRANITTVVKYGSAGFVNFKPEEFWANDVCYCLEPLDGVTDRYLYHALKSRQNDLVELRTDAVPPHLPTDAINSFEIPLPPVEVQEKIVDTLDMFTDYAVNLRREIDLRRQQLEYYRGKLLAFPVAE